MNHLDKVEKLRERADVSYEEAKAALEECNWDMLDALVKLETEGKVKGKTAGPYYTDSRSAEQDSTIERISVHQEHQSESVFTQLWDWICKVLRKSMENSLIMTRYGRQIMELPVLIFVILLLAFFWVVLPMMVVSLFFDISYSFKGDDLGKDHVNDAMGKATKVANDLKSDVSKDDI